MGNQDPTPTPPASDPTTAPATDPAPAPQPATDPEPSQQPSNDDQAIARIKRERDDLKQQLDETKGKLAEAKTLEDVEAAKADLQKEYEAKLLSAGIDAELVKAGCVNPKATKALIDSSKVKLNGDAVEGLDVAGLIKEYPYLFQATGKVATSANPTGAPDKEASRLANLSKVMGIPDKE